MLKELGLLNIEEFGDKKDDFAENRGGVAFYCRDCKKIVETTRKSKEKYIFTCNECSEKNISIGTLEGLKNNYKLK